MIKITYPVAHTDVIFESGMAIGDAVLVYFDQATRLAITHAADNPDELIIGYVHHFSLSPNEVTYDQTDDGLQKRNRSRRQQKTS